MPSLKLTGFGGIYPRMAERLLQDTAAQQAENVNLTSGEIRPIRQSKLIYEVDDQMTAFRAVDPTSEKWRTWAVDVDCARGPLPADVEGRYYWTGDGEPRWATYTNFGTTDYALGIPNPTTAPTVGHSGGTGSATTRFYRYTFFSKDGEESGPSPVSAEVTGKVDGTWAITGMQAFPTNSGTFTGVYATGVTTCTAGAAHWLRTGDEVVINSVTYTVTVTSSTVFKVTGDVSAYTAYARKAAWNTTSMTRRLYRTTGSSGSYQLVADGLTATSYNDTLTDAQILGDDLISDGWEPPPAGLLGLGFLPSGAGYGFVNNLLCFSEPYQSHAWPTSYQLACDYPIVQTESYGTVVVAGTEAYPYMADGVEPATATLQRVNMVWPCLSKRSMVSVGDGVMYATSAGLAYIASQGPQIFTQAFFTETEWKDYNPSTMACALSEGRVFVRWENDGGTPGLMLFKMQEPAPLTTSSVRCNGLYTDLTDGELYFVADDGVYKFDADDGYRLPYTWTSKEIELPVPMNLGAARVELQNVMTQADIAAMEAQYASDLVANATILSTYTGFGGFNATTVNNGTLNDGPDTIDTGYYDPEYVTFSLYSNGQLVTTKKLTQTTTFRLPAGYLTDNFYFKVQGTVRIKNVKLAETVEGLKQV